MVDFGLHDNCSYPKMFHGVFIISSHYKVNKSLAGCDSVSVKWLGSREAIELWIEWPSQ